MQIEGNSAIVGGAGGLDEATARRLHGAGATVVVENDDLNGEIIRLDGGLRFPPR